MSGPRLSLCVIARNEADVIARCLRSAAPVADEMIVVDTGSTDATVALARQEGATVFHFAWCDDFASARNAAIERATGDWILWLDADEWLLESSWAQVCDAITRAEAQAFYVLRQEVEGDTQMGDFIEMQQLRLWRNVPELRFVGHCHPHFGDALNERERRTGQHTFRSSIRIRHTGYQAHLLPGKLQRAARLLQLELAARPGQMYYEIELGRTWQRLGDPRGPALLTRVLEQTLARADESEPPSPLVAPLLEEYVRGRDGNPSQREAVLVLATRWFPDSPPLLAACGEWYYQRGEFARALPLLQRVARCAETRRYDRSIAFSASVLSADAWLNVAVCCHRMARLNEAERWYRRLLARVPDHAGARQNLAILRQQRQRFSRKPTDAKTAPKTIANE